ncbi:MAG: hypothetical protein EB034_02140 [Verrucomicrobia bacterium]|nr:hypothetical protein [Verrucomicrobiota bacterium]
MILCRGEQTGPKSHVQSMLQILPTEDAHLIVAAPELYEVLKAITVDGGFTNFTTENLEKAHAAIRKAEGRDR